MGDKEKFYQCSLFYCDKPIELPQPIVNVELSSEQSDEDKAKWDNLCGHTLSLSCEMPISRLSSKTKRLLFGKCCKLPRKLKKMIKKKYFVRYPKRISVEILRYAYILNNPENI